MYQIYFIKKIKIFCYANKINLLVFSLAAILSLSVVAMGEFPQAVTDKDHDDDHEKKLDFKKNQSLLQH
jgi:hypothetical protein